MVVVEMYCREQITIPEHLPLILKKYAKAVIRTQPYDLLRWSAAYFRCLALEHIPPAKLRFEPDQQFGSLTRGYVRTLVSQLGKGYFVDRKLLMNVWQGLCLPEEQLFDFLSLCRMLHWSHVHFLKLVAVMIGALNCDLPGTMKMICEVLTEEPEGSPSPIPLWMFRVCYKFLAELDCSDTQCFMDGQKLLPGDVLEEVEDCIEPPQIHKAAIFQQILIDEWKSRMKYDEFTPDINSDTTESNVITDTGSILSRVSSSFKFIGNFADPAEVLIRTPDFDAVILLLQEELENVHHEVSAKKIHEIMEKVSKTENSSEHLSKIGPPWNWISTFANQNCSKQSFNFVDDAVVVAADYPQEEECCVNVDSRHFTAGESRSKTFICDGSPANSAGSFKSRSSTSGRSASRSIDFTNAKKKEYSDKIVEIFEESGFDVEEKLLEKKFSETMILGLVQKPPDSLMTTTSEIIDSESVKSDDTTTAATVVSAKERNVTRDEMSQTTPQKMSDETLQNESSKEDLGDNCNGEEDEMHKSIIPPLPGIGKSISAETTERFLLYLMRRARQQGGMVYPRNWEEHGCPSMVD